MRRRLLVFIACSALLTGCESLGDLTSDAFDPGNATQTKFSLDSTGCAAAANEKRAYDIRGISATHAGRHEIFNRAYAACMRANGYTRRDWSPDIAIPYSIDPTPG